MLLVRIPVPVILRIRVPGMRRVPNRNLAPNRRRSRVLSPVQNLVPNLMLTRAPSQQCTPDQSPVDHQARAALVVDREEPVPARAPELAVVPETALVLEPEPARVAVLEPAPELALELVLELAQVRLLDLERARVASALAVAEVSWQVLATVAAAARLWSASCL
jgi:hypothetical protein